MTEESRNTRPVTVVRRDDQQYVGIGQTVRMDGFAAVAHQVPVVIGWALEQGLELAGPPFFRYLTIDMAAESWVEAGVPVVRAPDLPEAKRPGPTGEIHTGVLPSGHYATLTHIGPPSELMDATKRLLEWAAGEGLEWDVTPLDGVEHWGCRMESYKTDPRVEPDTGAWETELAFRLADLAPPTAGSGRPRR